MKLEEAQDLIDTADEESEGINCDFCPFTSEVGCTTEASCSAVTAQAARLIIAEKDSRIAELEKQNAYLVDENERMRCCENCDGHDIYGCENYYDCNTGCGQGDISYWQRKEAR